MSCSLVVKADKWFKLESTRIYVTDFALQPGATKEFEFDSDQSYMVGLKTDANREVREVSKKKYVRLSQKGHVNDIATLIGASRRSEPINGKFQFVAKNETDYPLNVVIYKSDPKPIK